MARGDARTGSHVHVHDGNVDFYDTCLYFRDLWLRPRPPQWRLTVFTDRKWHRTASISKINLLARYS